VTHFKESSLYFFTIYTLPEGDGKDAAVWYRSRINIVLDNTLCATQRPAALLNKRPGLV
jgi:hypothetical protein